MKTALPGRPGKTPMKTPVLRVLVVEDHADTRAALKTLLGMLAYQARFAVDVASALQAASEEPFDVLLSDIGLPDGDGWDMLLKMTVTGCRPPYAIAMSGLCLEEDAAKSRAAGFACHLGKPFLPEELMKALGAAALALA